MKHSRFDTADLGQLVARVTDLAVRGQCSPADALETIARLLSPERIRARKQQAVYAQFIGRLRQLRLRRNDVFQAPLFRDPAWDMLLEMFVADERGEALTVTSLCHASGVPLTTAFRHLQRMEEFGLLTRSSDRDDTRQSLVQPTPKAIEGVKAMAGLLLDEREVWMPLARVEDPDPEG